MRARLLPLLILFVAPALAQDLGFRPDERKKTHTLRDPLTTEAFEQPVRDQTEVAFKDSMLRELSFGEHPRLRQLWVSPYTGFATYPDPAGWKNVAEKASFARKQEIRRALEKFPRRYGTPAAIPALHRYRLALITYAALGRLNEELKAQLYLDLLYCARDEGNERAEQEALKELRPLLNKLADHEGRPAASMLRDGYLAGEVARLLGDEKTAAKRFRQAASRIERWKAARELRVPARLARAEYDWKDKSVEDLAAILEGKNKYDAQVAALLLVDRGAADHLLKHFGGKRVEWKKSLVRRAAEHPNARILPALRVALKDEDPYVALWAARAVGRLDSEEAVRVLIEDLEDGDEEVLVEGLADCAHPSALRELVRLAEEGSGFGGRPAAARKLALHRGDAAVRGLVRHVAAAESYNLSAALGLALRRRAAIGPALREALAAEKNPRALANLLRLAALIDDEGCLEQAKAHVQAQDPKVRFAALLVRARKGEGKSALVSAWGSAEPGDRPALILALGHAGAVAPVREALDPKVRTDAYTTFLAAIIAAGWSKDAVARRRLVELLDDRDPLVSASAAHALILAGDSKRVLALLGQAPYGTVSAIARACADAGLNSAVPALIAAYEADDGAWIGSYPGRWGPYGLPSEEIPEALRRLGGKQAQAFLEKIGA